MQDFRNLKVWQKAHQLALSVYQGSAAFPNHEVFGLRSQMRRACTSVPINLAEGCGRGSDADFGRFVQIAMGSARELEYEVLLARDLTYLSPETYEQLTRGTIEVKRMLAALLGTLNG